MKYLIPPLLLLIGCGPVMVDLTATMGANQEIDKHLITKQIQTDAQAEAQAGIIDVVGATLPLLLKEAPPEETTEPATVYIPRGSRVVVAPPVAASKPVMKRPVAAKKIDPCVTAPK